MDKAGSARPRGTRRVSRRPSASLKPRLSYTMASDLGAKIVRGVYQPGDSLPGEIAASIELQVSRNAYREAIRVLAAKGLVESRQKAGTLVTPRQQWNLLDPEVLRWMLSSEPVEGFSDCLLELRAIIEPAAAALAAQRRGGTDIAAMERALSEMRQHAPDSVEGERADEQFHDAIFSASGNELLSRLAAIIATSVEHVSEYKRQQKVERDTWPDHKDLFDAIRAQRPTAAHGAMKKLIEHAREDLKGTAPALKSA